MGYLIPNFNGTVATVELASENTKCVAPGENQIDCSLKAVGEDFQTTTHHGRHMTMVNHRSNTDNY